MRIKDFKKALEAANKDAVVLIQPFRLSATLIGSWRGDYAQPAIGWSADDEDGETAAEFLRQIEEIEAGAVFSGYKGGSYTFGLRSELHVDNYGKWSPDSEIESVFVREGGDEVVIVLRYRGIDPDARFISKGDG